MKSGSRYQLVATAVLGLLLSASLLRPIYPREQLLQHAPTIVAIALLVWCTRREWLSNCAMTCILVFLLLHVIGARYIYSYVPLGESLSWLSLGGEFAGRNHYDRLVHLAFGLLAVPPAAELSRRFGSLSFWWSCAFAASFVMTFSAAYEVFEWLLTLLVDPRYADNYNGQQGDAWDAQKDMALAGLGALAAILVLWLWRERDAS